MNLDTGKVGVCCRDPSLEESSSGQQGLDLQPPIYPHRPLKPLSSELRPIQALPKLCKLGFSCLDQILCSSKGNLVQDGEGILDSRILEAGKL